VKRWTVMPASDSGPLLPTYEAACKASDSQQRCLVAGGLDGTHRSRIERRAGGFVVLIERWEDASP